MHFLTMVVVDGKYRHLAEAWPQVELALEPYADFEMTLADSPYVENIDDTDYLKEWYSKATTERYVSPEGEQHDPREERFQVTLTSQQYMDAPANTYNTVQYLGTNHPPRPSDPYVRASICPTGWKRVAVPVTELMNLVEFANWWAGYQPLKPGETPDLVETHAAGWVEVDEAGDFVRLIRRTNPNGRWDWYVLGGRWEGALIAKKGTQKRKMQKGDPSSVAPTPWEGVDMLRIKDVDWEAMRERWSNQRKDYLHQVLVDLERTTQISREELIARFQAAAALNESNRLGWEAFKRQPEHRYDTIREYIASLASDHPLRIAYDCGVMEAMRRAGVTWDVTDVEAWTRWAQPLRMRAYIDLEGDWHEIQDGDDYFSYLAFPSPAYHDALEDWQQGVEQYLKSLPPTTWLAMIDCHI